MTTAKKPRTPAQMANDQKLRDRAKAKAAAPPKETHPEDEGVVTLEDKPQATPRWLTAPDGEIAITFISASGKINEAYTARVPATVLRGATTLHIGPFPESPRGWPEEWQDFETIPIAVDGEKPVRYPVTGPYTR